MVLVPAKTGHMIVLNFIVIDVLFKEFSGPLLGFNACSFFSRCPSSFL